MPKPQRHGLGRWRRRFGRLLRPRGMAAPPEPAAGYVVALLLLVSAFGVVLAGAALVGRLPSPLTWYVTRAAGLTLYLLLWLAVMTGLGVTLRLPRRSGGRDVVIGAHRFLSALALGLLALHLASLAFDATVPFRLAALLVPFASPAAEPWTGLGVIAAWLLIAVAASAVLWRLFAYRGWRALHLLTFPAYFLALAHGVGAGTDAGVPWMEALYAATAAVTLFAGSFRLLRRGARATVRGAATRPRSPADRFAPRSAATSAGRVPGRG